MTDDNAYDDDDGATQSEFGRGFVYCIGLFLAHEQQYQYYVELFSKAHPNDLPKARRHAAELFFSGAADHLHELRIPPGLSTQLRGDIEAWHYGVMANKPAWNVKDEDSVRAAIEEAKEILRRVDEEMLHVRTIRGDHR